MKHICLVYNPQSGDKSLPQNLDLVVEKLQEGGYLAHPYRLPSIEAVDGYIAEHARFMDAAVVCGGDGTINHFINAMKRHGLDIPLGIIPAGTANDFASFLGLPRDPAEAAGIITRGDVLRVDLGRVNGEYFVNVCAAGVLASVSQSIDLDFKNNFGKLAYYLKGLEQLKNLEPLRMRIHTPQGVLDEELYLFLALNSSGTGGFRKLAGQASVVDGKLDFIGVRARPLSELAVLFMRMLAQPDEYLNDSAIVYLQEESFSVEPVFDDKSYFYTDIDGERGPDLPVTINVEPGAIRVFV